MTYSFKEMKALCLDLPSGAEALEAEALRELARNYDGNPDTMQKGYGLGVFTLKVLILAAILSVSTVMTAFFCRDIIVDSFSGGPEFWTRVEKGLTNFANSPDLPAEKKARIIASLRKIHDKSRPYLDALLSEGERSK